MPRKSHAPLKKMKVNKKMWTTLDQLEFLWDRFGTYQEHQSQRTTRWHEGADEDKDKDTNNDSGSGKVPPICKRLKQWYNNHSRGAHARSAAGAKKVLDLSGKLMRRLAPYQTYESMFWESKLKAIIMPKWKTHLATVPGAHVKQALAFRNKRCRELLEEETDDVKQAVAVAYDKGIGADRPVTTDEEKLKEMQAVIEILPRTVTVALKEIYRLTGFVGTIMLGGPNPGQGGELESFSIHTATADGSSFKSSCPDFVENIEKPFISYLHSIYPQDAQQGDGAAALTTMEAAVTTTLPATPTVTAPADSESAAGASKSGTRLAGKSTVAAPAIVTNVLSPSTTATTPPPPATAVTQNTSTSRAQEETSPEPRGTPTEQARRLRIAENKRILAELDLLHAGSRLVGELDASAPAVKQPRGRKRSLRNAGNQDHANPLDIDVNEAEDEEVVNNPHAKEDDIESQDTLTGSGADMCMGLDDAALKEMLDNPDADDEEQVTPPSLPTPATPSATLLADAPSTSTDIVTQSAVGQSTGTPSTAPIATRSSGTPDPVEAVLPTAAQSPLATPSAPLPTPSEPLPLQANTSPDLVPPIEIDIPADQTVLATMGLLNTDPIWLQDAFKFLATVIDEPDWKHVLQSWLTMERLLEEDTTINNPALNNDKTIQPSVIPDWFKGGRKYYKIPRIGKAAKFTDKWYGWWRLRKGGKNGFVLILLTIVWWTTGAKTEDDTSEVLSALEDVDWAVSQMITGLPGSKKRGAEDAGAGSAAKRNYCCCNTENNLAEHCSALNVKHYIHYGSLGLR
ncbi:hypothetical protein FA95DRAFT_1577833 [Auriscalpium vulgare]|uniref:Uncharacterized protein n=1 Tax=Auriscalpium vulgare TaxID=40419 RepID=A0ACB8R4P5_9AGAM|nr:hypothetical protein FA95DRAFT_1577833 [Auriscalpium vulgare]